MEGEATTDFDIDVGSGGGETSTSEVGTGANTPDPMTEVEQTPQADFDFSDEDFEQAVITDPAPDPALAPADPPAPDPAPDPAPVVDDPAPDPEAETARNDFFGRLFQPIDEAITGRDRELKQVEIAGSTLDDLQAYDRNAHTALLNAGYKKHQEVFTEWVLGDLGIKPEQITAFLQAADTDPNAPQFPAPDEFGIVTLEDGTELDLSKDGDPAHRKFYESEKAKFEDRQKSERDAREQLARDEQAERERQAEAQEAALQHSYETYGNERIAAYERDTKEIGFDFGEGNEWMTQAALAYADQLIGQDKEISQLLKEANPLIASKSARAGEIGLQLDTLAKGHLKAAKEQFSNFLARSNQAQRAAMAGKPKIPADVPKVPAGTKLSDAKTPQTMKEVEDSLAVELGAMLG